jgi:uncharacterized protein (UPF0333 family)
MKGGKKEMDKKGQAAMEFLMTYGWAILAAIIAIGVLAYFGVFSPGKYMPNACTLNAPLGCDDYRVTSSGVDLVIRNGAGDAINVTNVVVGSCTAYTNLGPIADGNKANLTLTGCGTLTSGAKYKGDITVTYTTATGTYAKTATGSITAQVA